MFIVQGENMHIFKISALPSFKSAKDINKQNSDTNDKIRNVSLGLAGAGTGIIGGSLLLKGKKTTFSEYYEKLKTKPFKKLDKKIKNQLKTFVPKYLNAMPESFKKLKDGRTIVNYGWSNTLGDKVTDSIIFNNENQVIGRYIINRNPERGLYQGYTNVDVFKGGDILLGDLNKLPKGYCDSDYFVKSYKREIGQKYNENVIFYRIKAYDSKGNYTNTLLNTSTDGTPLSMMVSGGKVPVYVNSENCTDFKWGYKTVNKTKTYSFNK